MSEPTVTTEWLAGKLGAPELRIADASWYMPNEDGSGWTDYAAGHIPGAVFFDIDEIADKTTDLPHMLPTPDAFAEAAGRLGLTRDAEIVVYDSRGIFSAPRVWWSLRAMGFRKVRVLDGGLPKWRAEGRPLETSLASPAPARVTAAYDAALVRDIGAVRRIVEDGGAQLVDARAAGRFTGETPEPRAGLRSGHMPGACNVPWGEILNSDKTLKGAADLRAAFEAGGVDLTRPIVTTCGSGVSAALLALGLARLGRGDVAVYDGSWTEWGGRDDTPVATGR